MDPESKKLLEETAQLARDNHAMLKKMRRSQKNARMAKSIYWVVIIVLTYAAYLKVQPYLQQASDAYTAAQAQLDSIKNLGR